MSPSYNAAAISDSPVSSTYPTKHRPTKVRNPPTNTSKAMTAAYTTFIWLPLQTNQNNRTNKGGTTKATPTPSAYHTLSFSANAASRSG